MAQLKEHRIPATPLMPEESAEAALLAKGIVRRSPVLTPADAAHHHTVIPVALEGIPVSETLLEDRR